MRHVALLYLQIWVKPSAEMQYMYGNHVMKSGLGRITENTPAYTGVVIYSMSDIPLGFGVTAKSTADCRKMDPSGIVVFHQADVGEHCTKRYIIIALMSDCKQAPCMATGTAMYMQDSDLMLLQVSTSGMRTSCDHQHSLRDFDGVCEVVLSTVCDSHPDSMGFKAHSMQRTE